MVNYNFPTSRSNSLPLNSSSAWQPREQHGHKSNIGVALCKVKQRFVLTLFLAQLSAHNSVHTGRHIVSTKGDLHAQALPAHSSRGQPNRDRRSTRGGSG